MTEIIEQIPFQSWPELVNDLRNNNDESKIYRGHSNEFSQTRIKVTNESFLSGEWNTKFDLKQWKLISSFDRIYQGNYPFIFFLSQQLDNMNFKFKYKNYKYPLINRLSKCGQLERIYFLQHYGVQTCFIDFTRNPLVALYFAISTVKGSISYRVDRIGNPQHFPSGKLYISLFEFDYKKIADLLNVKSIDRNFSNLNYGIYTINKTHLAFDIHPLTNSEGIVPNENLKKQEGCFVLYEIGSRETSLDEFICNEIKRKGINEKGLIKEYRLDYNAIFCNGNIDNFKEISLFTFLDKNGFSGRTLFNDIQGLKYDLNFYNA